MSIHTFVRDSFPRKILKQFKENKYFATFTINFNKKEIIDFFEKKKVFFALPTKLDIFLLPILIENEKLKFFNQNKFYNNEWNSRNNRDFLIIRSGSLKGMTINSEGVLVLGGFTNSNVPSASEGGIYYNSDQKAFFFGKGD